MSSLEGVELTLAKLVLCLIGTQLVAMNSSLKMQLAACEPVSQADTGNATTTTLATRDQKATNASDNAPGVSIPQATSLIGRPPPSSQGHLNQSAPANSTRESRTNTTERVQPGARHNPAATFYTIEVNSTELHKPTELLAASESQPDVAIADGLNLVLGHPGARLRAPRFRLAKAGKPARERPVVSESNRSLRPQLSARSLRFLQKIKDKRKLAQLLESQAKSKGKTGEAKSFASLATNLTVADSRKHHNWVRFGSAASPRDPGAANQQWFDEEPAARGDGGGSVGAGSGRRGAQSYKGNESLEIMSDAVNLLHEERTDDNDDDGGDLSRLPIQATTTTTTTSALVNDLDDNNTEPDEQSQAHKQGGANKARPSDNRTNENVLPPKLRQKIIEQFIRNGGDPQNIVVSNSTITTISQSKRKTVTTVYKIVPSSQAAHLAGKFEAGQQQQQAKRPTTADRQPVVERKPTRRGKLKRILVTRIELPKKPSGNNATLDAFDDLRDEPLGMHQLGHNADEMGEFYRGPHETIFGLAQAPHKFSGNQRKQILGLDEMLEAQRLPDGQYDHERFQRPDVQQVSKHQERRTFQGSDKTKAGDAFAQHGLAQTKEKPYQEREAPAGQLKKASSEASRQQTRGWPVADDQETEQRSEAAPSDQDQPGAAGQQVANEVDTGEEEPTEEQEVERRQKPPPTTTSTTTTSTTTAAPALASPKQRGQARQSDTSQLRDRAKPAKDSRANKGNPAAKGSAGSRDGLATFDETQSAERNSKAIAGDEIEPKSIGDGRRDSLEVLKQMVLAKKEANQRKAQRLKTKASNSRADKTTGKLQEATTEPAKLDEPSRDEQGEPQPELRAGQPADSGAAPDRQESTGSRSSGERAAPVSAPAKSVSANSSSALDQRTNASSTPSATSGGGKTHNIMMLIDFGPAAATAAPRANRDEDRPASSLSKLDSARQQQRARNDAEQRQQQQQRQQIRYSSPLDWRDTNGGQWRPISSSQRPPAGQPPSAINVQIFNHPLAVNPPVESPSPMQTDPTQQQHAAAASVLGWDEPHLNWAPLTNALLAQEIGGFPSGMANLQMLGSRAVAGPPPPPTGSMLSFVGAHLAAGTDQPQQPRQRAALGRSVDTNYLLGGGDKNLYSLGASSLELANRAESSRAAQQAGRWTSVAQATRQGSSFNSNLGGDGGGDDDDDDHDNDHDNEGPTSKLVQRVIEELAASADSATRPRPQQQQQYLAGGGRPPITPTTAQEEATAARGMRTFVEGVGDQFVAESRPGASNVTLGGAPAGLESVKIYNSIRDEQLDRDNDYEHEFARRGA